MVLDTKGTHRHCSLLIADYLTTPHSLPLIHCPSFTADKPMSEPLNLTKQSASAPPIDDSVLLEYLGDDDALRREVLQQFLDTLTTDLQQLEAEVRECNVGAVQRSAHRLKGACYMVGTRPLGESAMALEQLAHADNAADFPAALTAITVEHQRLLQHLAAQDLKPTRR
jgi:HPt (histidine-containing phosphotransfer) domain-containing protein